MRKIFFDKITLGSAHSLKMGNTPEKADMIIIGAGKPDIDHTSLGLFEVATPNFNTFYPGVTREDLAPKEGDFILPIFRALSEVIVHKKVNPIDFSANSVLRDSMSKLLGQTVYPNHEPVVGNEVGVVSKVEWQKSYTTSNGIVIPAGINAQFKIDAKANPKIARNIMMDPPAIHSNSVTVSFGWEQSHPKMELNEFWGKLGTFGADGQLIRRVVTEVKNYHETSLVAHGADPFAQKVDDKGKIVNPEYANNIYSLAATGESKPKNYFFSYKDEVVSLTEAPSTPQTLILNNSENMKDLIAQLAAKFKKPEAEITEAFITQLITDGETATANLATATANLATANKATNDKTAELAAMVVLKDAEVAKVTSLTSELAIHKPISVDATTKLLEEVKRVYTSLKGDKADAEVLSSFDKSTNTQLSALLKDYSAELESKFPASCTDCGSHNVSRATAKPAGTPPAGGRDIKSFESINDEIRKEAKKGYIFEGTK